MIWSAVMNLYNININIILPILKKIKYQIYRHRHKIDSLSIINKYDPFS